MRTASAVLALVAVLIGAAAYFYLRPQTAPIPPQEPSTPATAAPKAEPTIRYPIPVPPEATQLPGLADSDPAMQTALAGLYGRESLARFFYLDDIIRRFVATIDSLPRQTAAQRLMPVKPAPGPFIVSGQDGDTRIAADNYYRYRPQVLAMEAVEAKKLVAVYAKFYPLFEQAYRDLGYPNGYFNDRLVEAIDDLLAAPDVPQPKLVQPKVLYQFADPNLEMRSAGQKMMIRLGTANAERVKDKLRAIRRELVSQVSKP
jgi:hypothetical protein